jgi:hypothetical protein
MTKNNNVAARRKTTTSPRNYKIILDDRMSCAQGDFIMNVRRQQPETTRTAIAACRSGSFRAYLSHGSQSVERKPMSILVGCDSVDWRGG